MHSPPVGTVFIVDGQTFRNGDLALEESGRTSLSKLLHWPGNVILGPVERGGLMLFRRRRGSDGPEL
eukprot:2891995-Rhodomonas_salina.2